MDQNEEDDIANDDIKNNENANEDAAEDEHKEDEQEDLQVTDNKVEEEDNVIEDADIYKNVNEEVKLDNTSTVTRRSIRRRDVLTIFGTYHAHLHTVDEK